MYTQASLMPDGPYNIKLQGLLGINHSECIDQPVWSEKCKVQGWGLMQSARVRIERRLYEVWMWEYNGIFCVLMIGGECGVHVWIYSEWELFGSESLITNHSTLLLLLLTIVYIKDKCLKLPCHC